MALNELTTSRTNIKRAEALARHGINTMDITSARPKFVGYGAGTCELCGKKNLKWLFQLHFSELGGLEALAKVMCDIDRDGAVTIKPIGSKCIVDWLEAVPESLEKIELMKIWDAEMRACKSAMKAKLVEDLCKAAGFDTPQAAYERFLDRFQIKPGSRLGYVAPRVYSHLRKTLTSYEINAMRRNATKIQAKTLSRKPCQEWLKTLLLITPVPAPPVVAPISGVESPKSLLERGDKAIVSGVDNLKPYYRTVFQSIADKVRENGDFQSDRQKKYYTDLLAKLEA